MDTLQAPSQESSPASRTSATAFIPLPIALGHVVRILGPEPDKSATVVHPLIKLDQPLGAFQSYVAGICTPAGELVVFEPNAKEFKSLARYQVADSGTYAYPVVAGNRVFIKDQNSVTLWSIE